MISLDKKKQPHVPERTCIGCSGKFAKGTLLRFVLVSDVHIEIDPRHIKPGRGTYVCKKKSCADRVVKQRGCTGLSGAKLERIFTSNL